MRKNEHKLKTRSFYVSKDTIKKVKGQGCLGGSVGWVSNFGSSHDLTVHGSEPRVRLCADSAEPGACFRFCVSSPSLSAPPPLALALSLSLKNKHSKKIFLNQEGLSFLSETGTALLDVSKS